MRPVSTFSQQDALFRSLQDKVSTKYYAGGQLKMDIQVFKSQILTGITWVKVYDFIIDASV